MSTSQLIINASKLGNTVVKTGEFVGNAYSEVTDKLSRAMDLFGIDASSKTAVNNAEARSKLQAQITMLIGSKDQEAVAEIERRSRGDSTNSLASEIEMLGIHRQLLGAGLDKHATLAGSEVVHRVSVVNDGSAAQVGAVISDTFSRMDAVIKGSTIEEKMTRIGNVLTKVNLHYGIDNFEQLGASMKRTTLAASENQLSLLQAATAVGTLNAAGLEGESGGDALAELLGNMEGAAGELKFDVVRDSEGGMDLGATLENIKQALSGYKDDDQRKQDLEKIFGKEGSAGLEALLKNQDQYQSGLATVDNSTGLVGNSYKTLKESQYGQLTMAKQNAETISTDMGAGLLKQTLPAMVSATSELGEFLKNNTEATSVLATALAAGSLLTGDEESLPADIACCDQPMPVVINSGRDDKESGRKKSGRKRGRKNSRVEGKGVGDFFRKMMTQFSTKLPKAPGWLGKGFSTVKEKFPSKAPGIRMLGMGARTLGRMALGPLGMGLAAAEGIHLLYKNWESIGNWVGDLSSSEEPSSDKKSTGSNTTRQAAATTMATAVAMTPVAAGGQPLEASAPYIGTQNNHIQITVHQQQMGENSEALALQIREEVERALQQLYVGNNTMQDTIMHEGGNRQ